jgi:hypothetical protein
VLASVPARRRERDLQRRPTNPAIPAKGASTARVREVMSACVDGQRAVLAFHDIASCGRWGEAVTALEDCINTIGNARCAISHQPSAISHPPSAISHQPPAILHQPSAISYHQPLRGALSCNGTGSAYVRSRCYRWLHGLVCAVSRIAPSWLPHLAGKTRACSRRWRRRNFLCGRASGPIYTRCWV